LAKKLSPAARVAKRESRVLGWKPTEKVPAAATRRNGGKRKGPKKYLVDGKEVSRKVYLANQREAYKRKAAKEARNPGWYKEMKLGREDKEKRNVIISGRPAEEQEEYKAMSRDQLLAECVANKKKVEQLDRKVTKQKECLDLVEQALVGMADYAIGDDERSADRRQEIHLRMRQLVLTEDTNEFISARLDMLVDSLSYAYGVSFWDEEGVFITRWEAENGNNNGG
jgi:hypothetical protein